MVLPVAEAALRVVMICAAILTVVGLSLWWVFTKA